MDPRGTSLTINPNLNARLLSYSVHQLRPHPSYVRHKFSVQAFQIAALEEHGELAFRSPLFISGEGFIIDGYARWELAKRHGRSTLICLQYDITEQEALELLIQTHRRSQGLNDFRRIQLALDLEHRFKDRALLNRREGGRLKALSTLTEAEKVDSRRTIAQLAHVSVGNVHKVKYILANSYSALREAATTGEISINLAEKWSHDAESKQQENLRLVRITRGLKKRARNLVAAQASLSPEPQQQMITVGDLFKLLHHLSVIFPEQSNELGSVEVKLVRGLGPAILVPQSLFSSVKSEKAPIS